MKIIFFGLGSIGRRHAQLLLKTKDHELFALRSRLGHAGESDLDIRELADWSAIDHVKPDAAFITNPTSMHIPTALECAKRKMALFIEKPVGASVEGLDELNCLVIKERLTSYVAYVLRFHPVIIHLKQMIEERPCLHMKVEAASYLPTWRPGRDHTQVYSARKELGGGVVFDLSHEIDYVHYLLGGIMRLEGSCKRLGNVTVDADDCADMQIEAKNGRANVHLSFLSHVNQRRITLYFQDQTAVADLVANIIYIYKENALIEQINLSIEKDELFKRQLDFFFKNINNPQMMNNLSQASSLFGLICQFKERNEKT